MSAENDLLQKLAISKKIMDRHNNMGRSNTQSNYGGTSPMVEDYQPISAKYNLPQDLLAEQPKTMSQPVPQTKDRILNSKLPDEIKRLMIEHPIEQPNMGSSGGSVLSDELVEKASRLMNVNAKGEPTNNQRTQTTQPSKQVGLSLEDIKNVVRETVEDVLRENELLTESESKSNEIFKFRVGDHIFEGKVLRIKKVSK
jgi:hypothetical protein